MKAKNFVKPWGYAIDPNMDAWVVAEAKKRKCTAAVIIRECFEKGLEEDKKMFKIDKLVMKDE